MVTGDFIDDDVMAISKDQELCSVLYYSSHSIAPSHERIARLLEAGASPNARHQTLNRPAFSIAAFGGHTAAMKQLLKAGADLTLTNNKSCNCLHEAASRYWPKAASLILLQPAAKTLINQKNSQGQTPLAYMLAGGSRQHENAEVKNIKQTTRRLLDAGADATQTDESGYTALMYGTDCNLPEVVAMLIPQSGDIDLRNLSGETALSIAINNSQIENAKLLLEAGANPNLFFFHDTTLVHCAIFGRHKDDNIPAKINMLSLLSQWGAAMDQPDDSGKTPLAYALKENHKHELVNALLDAGATIPENYQTHWAAQKRFAEAHARYDATIGATPPDVSSITTTDLIWFSNIGVLCDALRPALWQNHREQLDTILIELPPYLAERIAAMPISMPTALIGGWSHEGISTPPPISKHL